MNPCRKVFALRLLRMLLLLHGKLGVFVKISVRRYVEAGEPAWGR